jgi:LysR family carnitine catabolism transcriptional activator
MAATLKQLEAFVAAARTRSFSGAAELVHVSQPALTSMIKKLEERLGVKLFERSSRGASLTPAGRELLPTIDRLIAELNETLANVLSGTSPRGGIVSIACIPSVAAIYLPPLIAAFEKKHPAVRVELQDAMPENRGILGMLRADEIDLGIASPSEDARDLQFHMLFEDELVALLPCEHPASRSDTIAWKDLVGIPLIGMAYQSNVRLLVDKTFARIGVSKRPHAEVSLITTAVGMARAGLGVAVMPSTAAQICNLDGLAVLLIVEPVVRRPLGFLYPSMKTLSPAAKRFMLFVSEEQAGRSAATHCRKQSS